VLTSIFALSFALETAFFTLRSFLRLPSNQAHQAHQSSLTDRPIKPIKASSTPRKRQSKQV
jgi:hypothetical protein